MDIELSKIWREDCSEVTEEDNEAAIMCNLKLGLKLALEMIVYNARDRSGGKSGMTPPLRRRGLGTGQTSQTSLLLFRPPASPYSRTPNSLRIRFTCHNVSPRKEVPRRYGYVLFGPRLRLVGKRYEDQRLTHMFTYSQAYDSLLRCRYAYPIYSEIP